MLREAPAMTVRQRLGELLNEVQYREDSILVTKADSGRLSKYCSYQHSARVRRQMSEVQCR